MTSLYVDIRPLHLELDVGASGAVAVSITNSSAAIEGYRVRVFGLDPEWVNVTPPRVAVFPGETTTVQIELNLPESYPAGPRQFTVQIQSETDPDDFALVQLSVNVGRAPRAKLKLDPGSVTGGKRATFNLVVINEGNTPLHAVPEGVDPEEMATFEFLPFAVDVGPGRRETIESRVVGKRPWFGTPKVRILNFAVTTPDKVETVGSFIQRPRISRWLMSIMGLIAAAAVFAAVLSRTVDSVVKKASVDPGVLNAALDKGAAGGARIPLDPLTLTGQLKSRTTGKGIAGVQVDLFLASDTTTPLYTAVTSDDGTYTFGRLAAGDYKLRFTGAGFAGVWYPDADNAGDAAPVTLAAGKDPPALGGVQIGGRPGSVVGKVDIDDPKGVTATLFLPGQIDVDTNAVVQKVAVGPDGAFAFQNVPSPNVYQLLVEKPGFAPDVRDIVLAPAQNLTGVVVTLRRGDGSIKGTVSTPDGPLGGVVVEATDGTTKITTASLTEGEVGTYVLRGLPTPGTYTVTVHLKGFTGASRTISLGQEEQVTDVAFALARATGTIRGTVNLAGVGPLGGVTVTVTGGDVALTTTTVSQGGNIGTYLVEGLPIPATYTISFTRPGLLPQVHLEDLDPLNGTADASGIDATMVVSTATVRGVIRNSDGNPVPFADVVLNDGNTERALVTAHDPLGEFEFSGVVPGTYTLTATLPGTDPAVVLVNVTASETQAVDLTLSPQASLSGIVTKFDGISQYVPFENAVVRLFAAADFPGSPQVAKQTVLTDANGAYHFAELGAPEDFVIAVYANDIAVSPLDSKLVLTQPSIDVPVATFQVIV